MKLPYTTAEKLAGFFLFVCFGLAAAGLTIVGLGQDWFRSYADYFALYQEGYGLLPGVKVKFLRTDIGRVVSLEITETNQVKIHLTVRSEFARHIKGDSQANIKSPTLIGSEYIEIMPGSAQSLPIPLGGQIPAVEPKTIDDVLAALQLEDKLKQIEAIMGNINSLTYQIQDPQGPILGTMDNIRRITGQVAAGEGSLGGLVTREEAYQEIMAMLREMRGVSESLNSSAGAFNARLPELTAKIDLILRQVELGTRSLPEVARGAREGLRDVDQVLDSVKRNFLIRGNLAPDRPPEALTRPAREGRP
ncbi:MAG: MlaD family protein [Deltaproteobacteria bacterium]|jgi:phospholipid/cholesterol/gamma-HCH transport system substrate-binding protein|nr:MlaD family protein [Deltaproteobacteria bacterium]